MARIRGIQKAEDGQGRKIKIQGMIIPGEKLQKEFKAMKISQTAAARQMNMIPSNLNDIIKGKRDVSISFALRLEKAFGFDPVYWLELQIKYDIAHARQDYRFKKVLAKISGF